MAVIWQMLYGFIVILGKCSFQGSEAQRTFLKKPKNLHGLYQGLHEVYQGNDIELKNDLKKINWDNNLMGLTVNNLDDVAEYHDCFKRSPPESFIYHKTLKKMEGKPSKIKEENGMLVDSRIRVSPLGFEPFQNLDFPLMARLSDLNNLNDIGSFHAKNNDEQVSIEKLRGFLTEAIRKSNRNSIKGRKSRLANLTKKIDKPGQQWLNNKGDLMKLLVATYPLQVSLSQGGLLKHFLEKGSDRKFRPEEFIMGISSDPSFSSINEAVADENYANNKQELKKEVSFPKIDKIMKQNSPQIFNNSVSETKDRNLLLDENSVERIHQSAEETVFKNVLNELISDIPHNLGISTIRTIENISFIDSLLKDTERLKEIVPHTKSVKINEKESTTVLNDINPCVKIKVKNGPVTLTFQSQARRGTTRIPYTDPSNIPVFKINSDEINLNKANQIGTEPSFKNVLSALTEELNSGEFSKDAAVKANMSCCSDNKLEKIATSYLLENPHMGGNESKKTQDVNEKNVFEKADSQNSTKLTSDQIFIPAQIDKLTNYTTSNITNLEKLFDPEVKYIPKSNISYAENKIDDSYARDKIDDSYKPSGTVAIACPFGINSIIFPNHIKGVHRFGPSKHLFLTRTGSGSYQFSHDADRLRLAAHLSRSNSDSRCRYVPKLYYNDLVVSKGLVGQHPPKDDTSSAVLSDSTLKKMEMLNILKFYLDSLSPERNFTVGRHRESFIFNPMLKNNRKYFIKL